MKNGFDATTNIKIGSTGEHVRRIQYFLNSLGHYPYVVDGFFGEATANAVKLYQAQEGIPQSGEIGNWTLARMLSDRLQLIGGGKVPLTSSPKRLVASVVPNALEGDDFPPRPPFRPLTGNDQRARVFGKYEFRSAPEKGNPEAIEILGDWEDKNIELVQIPELAEVTKGRVKQLRFHKRGVYAVKSLWSAWGKAGLLDRVLTYEGAFVPRFIRGSRETLSNHAFGSAFDVNYEWNRLGQVPAFVGQKGCVRELVELAHKFGFYWGGHFSRRDAMHFEVSILLKEGEYLDIDYSSGTYKKKSH